MARPQDSHRIVDSAEACDEEAPEEEVADEIFMIVEESATPKGGYAEFYKYIRDNLYYPSRAKRMGIEGKVFVQFVVSEDGTLSQVQAIKGIDTECDKEAVKVVRNAPAWNPPRQRGVAVKQRVSLAITFRLQ